MPTAQARWTWMTLVPLVVVQLWAAHAVVFFAHEYAHAVVAWALGWKASPFDLDYARPSLKVLLIQLGISQKVDEAPIYAAGHSLDVGLIAAAGMVLGNGLVTYPLSRLAYHTAARRGRPGWALLAFWMTVASVGNFIDYVPIRTFTQGEAGDMASIERAFGWSPWLVLLVLGLPTLAAVIHLFRHIVPTTVWALFPASAASRYGIAVLSVFLFFGFYGAVGLLEGGEIARRLSLVSVFVLLPALAILEVLLLRRSGRAAG